MYETADSPRHPPSCVLCGVARPLRPGALPRSAAGASVSATPTLNHVSNRHSRGLMKGSSWRTRVLLHPTPVVDVRFQSYLYYSAKGKRLKQE